MTYSAYLNQPKLIATCGAIAAKILEQQVPEHIKGIHAIEEMDGLVSPRDFRVNISSMKRINQVIIHR
jgi:hypothetical protein